MKEYLKSIGKTEKDSSGQDKDSLKNEDFYDSSGWAFILNGVVMDMDLAAFPMEDGDTLQIVFKLADGVF